MMKCISSNFTDSTNKYVIQKEDIFKHLFIWAVLMNRREISIMFWKKEDKDLICKFVLEIRAPKLKMIGRANIKSFNIS